MTLTTLRATAISAALLLPAAAGAGDPCNEPLDEIWVGSWTTHNVLRVAWPSGRSLGDFVPPNSGGLLLRYNGASGAFIDVFADLGAMGLTNPLNMKFFPGPMQPDCNGNLVGDACDIAQETSPDVNGNGVPDECECLPDFNGDGNVGIIDFLALLATWGPCPGCPQDLDNDGVVGIVDFLALLASWGSCA